MASFHDDSKAADSFDESGRELDDSVMRRGRRERAGRHELFSLPPESEATFSEEPLYRDFKAPTMVADHSSLGAPRFPADVFSTDAPTFQLRPQPKARAAPSGYAPAAISMKAAPQPFASVCPPTMPSVWVLSQTRWTSTAPPSEICRAVQEALSLHKVDFTFSDQLAEFSCAAVVKHRTVTFTVRLFSQTDDYVVEFMKRSGDALTWADLYRDVKESLPEHVQGREAQLSLFDSDDDEEPMPSAKGFAAMPAFIPEPSVPVLSCGDAAPLVEMTRSALSEMVCEASQSLASLSSEPRNAGVFVKDGILQRASELASSKQWPVALAAMTCISNIADGLCKGAMSGSEGEALVAACRSCLPSVSEHIRNAYDAKNGLAAKQQLRRECCRTLASLCAHTPCARLVADAKVTTALHLCTVTGDKDEATHANACLASLAAM